MPWWLSFSVHLLHVNTISISPAFGTCRLHVDPASSLRLRSAHGQYCTLANWCQWPTALLAVTLAQRFPKAMPPEGHNAIITVPLEVVRTCQKNLARKQKLVTFDGKFMMVDPNGPVGKNAHLWWNLVEHWLSQNVGCLVLWHALYFRSKTTQLTASVPFSQPIVFDGSWISRRLPFTTALPTNCGNKNPRRFEKIAGKSKDLRRANCFLHTKTLPKANPFHRLSLDSRVSLNKIWWNILTRKLT